MSTPGRDGKTEKSTGKSTAKSVTKRTEKNRAKSPAKKSAAKPVKKVAKKATKKALKGRTIPTRAKGAAKKTTAKKTASKQTTTKTSPVTKTAAKKTAVKKSPAAKAAPALLTTKIEALKSRRPKTFAAGNLSRDFGFPSETPELPEIYGEDRLVLMTKDPEYLFAYWEITPERQAAGEKAMRAGEEYREALRLNWTARDLFDANYALMPVSLTARKWYLRVPYSGLPYQIEIGWLGSQGHFISLLMSNPSDAPESWTATRRRLKQAGVGVKGSVLARALAAGRPQGSSELSSGLPRVDKVAVPGDWNFAGPGSVTSSFGKKAGKGRVKPGPRG